jgi:hypothetical protein
MTKPEFERLERPVPIVRADAMLNIEFERRDLQQMCRFAQDFGLIPVNATGETRYFRGHGRAPYLVALRASDRDAFCGFSLAAGAAVDLDELAKATGSTIEPLHGPGGGRAVHLSDPDGLRVSLVHGFEPLEPLTGPIASSLVNTPDHKPRINATVRTPLEPSPLFKLGHVVLQRTDFRHTAQWYMRHFGLIPSDVQCLPQGQPALGFFRLDRGPEPADHHSIALLGGPGTNLLHVSFETLDLDTVGQGNQYLRARGWKHHWGIGRHVLGSQVFDYWKDPAGDEWEHYADGDVMNADYPTGYSPLTRGGLWAWGDDLPDSSRPDIAPQDVPKIHAAGGFGNIDYAHVKGLMEALSIQPRPWLR